MDHFLPERAREKAASLSDKGISDTMGRAFEAGAQGFNFPSAAARRLLNLLANCGYSGSIGLYPMIPDIETYISILSSQGTIGMLTHVLGSLSWGQRAKTVVRSGLSFLTADPMKAMKVLIDVEMSRLQEATPSNAKLRGVLVHEAVTDVAVSFGAGELIKRFIEYTRNNHHVSPGFVTRNFVHFVEFCKTWELPLEDIIIMTPFNKIGFQMTPSREACEKTLSKLNGANVIAISVLAGGQLRLSEAIEYLSALRNLRAVAVGASTAAHAEQTFTRLREEFNKSA